jgi:hypothetical protein
MIDHSTENTNGSLDAKSLNRYSRQNAALGEFSCLLSSYKLLNKYFPSPSVNRSGNYSEVDEDEGINIWITWCWY